MIGVSATRRRRRAERPAEERFYPAEMTFPLTAFLEPNSRLRDPGRCQREPVGAPWNCVDPVASRRSARINQVASIETDLTKPAGVHVVADRPWPIALARLFRPEKAWSEPA